MIKTIELDFDKKLVLNLLIFFVVTIAINSIFSISYGLKDIFNKEYMGYVVIFFGVIQFIYIFIILNITNPK